MTVPVKNTSSLLFSFINAKYIFRQVWKIIRWCIESFTRKRIVIDGNGGGQILLSLLLSFFCFPHAHTYWLMLSFFTPTWSFLLANFTLDPFQIQTRRSWKPEALSHREWILFKIWDDGFELYITVGLQCNFLHSKIQTKIIQKYKQE